MKYYVISGQLRETVAGEHITCPLDAAREAIMIRLKEDIGIAPVIIVSEQGCDIWNHGLGEDETFLTLDVLEACGFKIDGYDEDIG